MAIKAKWHLRAMALDEASQTTLEQLLMLASCFIQIVHAILIPVITYWCVLINVSNSTAMFWVLFLEFSGFYGANWLLV